jgi:hypothetical protein
MEHFRDQLRQDFKDYPSDAVAPLGWFLHETHEAMRELASDDTYDETETINSGPK